MGRPRKGQPPLDLRDLGVLLEVADWERLDALARRYAIPRSTMARMLIKSALAAIDDGATNTKKGPGSW